MLCPCNIYVHSTHNMQPYAFNYVQNNWSTWLLSWKKFATLSPLCLELYFSARSNIQFPLFKCKHFFTLKENYKFQWYASSNDVFLILSSHFIGPIVYTEISTWELDIIKDKKKGHLCKHNSIIVPKHTFQALVSQSYYLCGA